MRKNKFQNYKKIAAILLLLGLSTFLALHVSSIQAQSDVTVTYGSFLDLNDNNCKTNNSNAEDLSQSEKSRYDDGEGITKGNRRIYKSTQLDHCCFEAVSGKATGEKIYPGSCKDAIVPSAASPFFVTTGGNLHYEFGIARKEPSFDGSGIGGEKASFPSEFTYSTWQNVPSGLEGDLSYSDYLLSDYAEASRQTPGYSGFGSDWYEYLKNLTAVNATLTTTDVSSISGNFNSNFTADLGGQALEGALLREGDLDVEANSTCNGRYLIFVAGDLTINPSVELANTSASANPINACMFVVQGVTTIKDNANGADGITIDGQAYDLLQLGLIAHGGLVVEHENGQAGLAVDGLLAGSYADLQRDIGSEKPSIWVNYDPRYSTAFQDELRLTTFYTREKNYQPDQ